MSGEYIIRSARTGMVADDGRGNEKIFDSFEEAEEAAMIAGWKTDEVWLVEDAV